MSTATEISRLTDARNTIRDKLVDLGLATSTAKLDVLADAVDSIANRGAVSATVQEGDTYTIPAGYHNGSGTVSGVSGGGNYSLQSKTITPTKSQQSVTPDSGYYGLSDVTVAAIPEAYQNVSAVNAAAGDVLSGKVIVDATGASVTGTMTNNGAVSKTLDASENNQSYTVPKGYHSGSGTVNIVLESKSATPSTTSQTAVAAGKYTTGAVTVDPIPSQYIVPSGTKEITENGTGIDVSSYAAVDVAVPGQEPTGIKYIYTDIDGEGAWDVGGYKYCSVDYAPLRDNKARIWVKLTDDLSITINITCYQTNGVIAWGDNTTDEWSASAYQKTHTYATGGIYAIEVYPTGGEMYFRLENLAFSQSSSSHDTKVVGAEMYNAAYETTGTAFRYCENLKCVTIAEDVYTSISAQAFNGCISLETIKIPESVTDLGVSICAGCTSLLTAYLPSGITNVPDSGFRDCSSLREVHMASTTPPTMSRTKTQTTNTFYNTPSTMVIYVPYSSDHSVIAAYQSATNWSDFAIQMQEEPQ